MPALIEERFVSLLAGWIDDHRPEGFSESVPIHVARRDDPRSRPCVVVDAAESRAVSAMPNTARIRLEVHLFSQVDDTPAETHAQWAMALAELLADKAALRETLGSESFALHDLIERESTTTPDESRGRQTVLAYEAVVSGV